jgi:[ribosomal protein S5]-alanine N-acetyltransferase
MGVIDHPGGTIEVGYWFGVEYQGKGHASEALRATLDQVTADPALAHRSISAECRPDDAASIRLLTKTGFHATGRPGPRSDRIEFALRSGNLRGNNGVSNFRQARLWNCTGGVLCEGV